MRSLLKPTEIALDVFSTCISKVKNAALKSRLNALKPVVQRAADAYDQTASTSNLHNYPRNGLPPSVTKSEMTSVYTYRMVPKTQPGRHIYERLLLAPTHSLCPLCGVGIASTLDHHLPKSKYPLLSVVPTNLVPSCERCQGSKMEEYPSAADKQWLHPYYDNFSNITWLHANVVQGAPATFDFAVDPQVALHQPTVARLKYHLELFDLTSLFASNASNELLNRRQRLQKLHDSAGATCVRDYLLEETASLEAANRNSWQTAMYRASSSSAWFCDGGFSIE